jgi:RNA polymerase sigma-70 factor (ECF subfamily)
VNGSGEAVGADLNVGHARPELEIVFEAQYDKIARVIAGVIRDPARAEELAVEVFLKWSKTPRAQGENSAGWLYRTAVRLSLDELRRERRRGRYERLLSLAGTSPTPEQIQAAKQDHDRVRVVLSVVEPRQAELLLLRSHGLSYQELASALGLNPASVGTLLSRAEQRFRKEYVKRYGEQ